jgi:homospermidine synthase
MSVAGEPPAKRVRHDDGQTRGLPEAPTTKFHKFEGKTFLIMGFGSIGMGSLPLVLRHIDMRPEQLVVLTGPDRKEAVEEVAKKHGFRVLIGMLTEATYKDLLAPLNLQKGDFMLNVTVDVSSTIC